MEAQQDVFLLKTRGEGEKGDRELEYMLREKAIKEKGDPAVDGGFWREQRQL